MDISAFADENFDVKNWINTIFKSSEAEENKEMLLASAVTKLQLYVQQVNSALEDTSQQVLQNLPRVMHDTEMLHKEALLLREKMYSVKEEIAKVERDTGESMSSLEHIDRIKTEMQAAKQALHEADNWTVLAADIEEVFESHNIEEVAAKLVSMQQSLAILVNTADYEDRKLQLEGLKNRLEAIASPQLVKAFTSGSIEQSKKFVAIFTGMDRLPQLITYWHKCEKGALCNKWRTLVEVEQDQTITDWMHSFYDSLLLHYHQQVKWCGQVFFTSKMLCNLYTDVLNSLDPTFNTCIEAALKQQTEPLMFLTDLKQTTNHFAINLYNAISNQGKQSGWDDLVRAVFSPYAAFMTRYSTLEQAHMAQQLVQLPITRDDIMDTIQGLGQFLPGTMSIVADATKRCLQFTEGCGFCGLITAVKIYLQKCLEHYSSALRLLERKEGERDDWNMFQMCLTLLQNVGDFLSETEKLERELVQTLVEILRKMKNSLFDSPSLLLSTTAQAEWNSLVATLHDGHDLCLLGSIRCDIEKVCRKVYHTTYQVIFMPIQMHLDHARDVWNNSKQPTHTHNMPDYSYSPQEYITQIGEYVMTLPQHLEPFLVRENASLIATLRRGDVELVEWGAEGGGLAHNLLGLVTSKACHAFVETILSICELSPSDCKQLATDIGYLGNVLEDVGFGLSEPLEQVAALVRLPVDTYQAESAGCSARLVAAVRQMRNITSV